MRGDVDGAIARVSRRADQAAVAASPRAARRQACAEALLGEAEVLEHARPQATRRSRRTSRFPRTCPTTPMTASTATYRAGELLLEAEQDRRRRGPRCGASSPTGPTSRSPPMRCETLARRRPQARRARARRPDRQAAHAARRDRRSPTTSCGRSPTSTEHELGEPDGRARALRSHPRRLSEERPARRRALARARGLSRELGDPKGAVDAAARAARDARGRARRRAATSRSGSTTRSSSSARSCATTCSDLPGAIAAFRQLPKDYPASILKDDALLRARGRRSRKADDAPARARAIADLRKQSPDSKYIDAGQRARRGARRARDAPRSGCTTCTSATAAATCSPASRSTSRRGAKLGLIGPAASGKSVILKLICGLEQPDRGAIEVLGESVVGKREVAARRAAPAHRHAVPELRAVRLPDGRGQRRVPARAARRHRPPTRSRRASRRGCARSASRAASRS